MFYRLINGKLFKYAKKPILGVCPHCKGGSFHNCWPQIEGQFMRCAKCKLYIKIEGLR